VILSFRWYGPDDPVRLADIRQIPRMAGIVTSLGHLPPGAVWTADAVRSVRHDVEAHGLRVSCIESIPVTERVKLGAPGWDADAEAWCASLEAVAEGLAGGPPPVVCYNFMPVFDWTRTRLQHPLGDGSAALAFRAADLPDVQRRLAAGGLPGWMDTHGPDALARLRAAYAEQDEARLWDNLAQFLAVVVPVAERLGVRLAIHPDDPPWPVFDLPRIITSGDALARVCGLVESPANGVTLCTGSLGADPEQAAGLPDLARRLGPRVHFAHLRNVGPLDGGDPRDFTETAHPDGRVDLPAVVEALVETGFAGPLRPDHGRAIWGEATGPAPGEPGAPRPGYGLYDRALGATYLAGLWDATARRATV
jgi:mannonate dehydratase